MTTRGAPAQVVSWNVPQLWWRWRATVARGLDSALLVPALRSLESNTILAAYPPRPHSAPPTCLPSRIGLPPNQVHCSSPGHTPKFPSADGPAPLLPATCSPASPSFPPRYAPFCPQPEGYTVENTDLYESHRTKAERRCGDVWDIGSLEYDEIYLGHYGAFRLSRLSHFRTPQCISFVIYKPLLYEVRGRMEMG